MKHRYLQNRVRHQAEVGLGAALLLGDLARTGKKTVSGGLSLTRAALSALLDKAPAVALGLPVAAGLAGGTAWSKLTGPSSTEVNADEARLVNATLETMLAEHRRKRLQQERTARKQQQRQNSINS